MAAPYHPLSKQIDQLLLRFYHSKEICAKLKVHGRIVANRALHAGFKREYITDEEKRHLLQRRGVVTPHTFPIQKA